ncbi:hypothetical protein LTR08_005214 [Meristemomyces frigidus]|nr:hypothetical protein LTR08_005214 [Meristemomyces frigidus]
MAASPETRNGRRRSSTVTSVAYSIQNAATELLNVDPPVGFVAATADAASHAPTISEIRRGSFSTNGWHAEPEKRRTWSQGSERRRSRQLSESAKDGVAAAREERGGRELFAPLTEEPSPMSVSAEAQRDEYNSRGEHCCDDVADTTEDSIIISGRTDQDTPRRVQKVYTSGYIPPPKLPWTTSTWIGLKVFWKWFCTPFGFLVTIYGLNVVAWGGMLFLLLCNASKQMCWAPVPGPGTAGHRSLAAALALDNKYPRYYNCNDINSPRRVWLEIDSQILNALFCVTGFGLIPWRFRDLWYLLHWRLTSEKRAGRERKLYGLRVLAGIYRGWFRLPGSDTLDQYSYAEYERAFVDPNATAPSATLSTEPTDVETGDTDTRLPLPSSKRANDPLTDIRAPPTAAWKLDFFVWSQVINTFFQVGLCGVMWGFSRYNRPGWTTGLLIALACIIAGAGGVVSFLEGKKVKKVEGFSGKLVQVKSEEAMGPDLEETRTEEESVHGGEKERAARAASL